MKQRAILAAVRLVIVEVMSGVLLVASLGLGQASAATAGGSCQTVTIPVALAEGHATDQTVSATLCAPTVWAAGAHDLDVLLHGATYNRSYWDWPQDSPTYSYVSRTLLAGRATLAYDQIGSGQSSRPASVLVTPAAVAYVLHEVIQWGYSQGYAQITSVGHSFGSMTAIHEAATYHDINRLVITGLFHAHGPQALLGVPDFYPAALDPAFIGRITDAGYLTTIPGSRGNLFYNLATADPAVIAYDEAHKDVVSATQFGLAIAEFEVPAGLNIAAGVTAPVLSISGQEDAITCGLTLNCLNPVQVQANETAYYSNAPSVTTATVANTGHDINLHPSAADSFAVINSWIQSH